MKPQKKRIKIYYGKIRKDKKSSAYLAVDFFMIALVMLSIVWMIVDWHFIGNTTRNVVQDLFPNFFNWYDTKIHPHYLEYDAYFVTIFLAELFIKWGIAIVNKKYMKWWFYPFIHWYDVLGCIPIGTFRILRLIRIYSMVIRLDKKGFIDLKHTAIYRLIKRNTDILAEEVSDKVVDNVLLGVQDEIYTQDGSIEKIIKDVIQPNQAVLVKWIAQKVQQSNQLFYDRFHDQIKEYLQKNIDQAVESNKSIKRIDKIPLLGKQITETLQESISDITYQVVDLTLKDLSSQNKEEQINQLADVMFETMLSNEEKDMRLDMVVKDMVSKSIDVMREQVAKKQWKTREKI